MSVTLRNNSARVRFRRARNSASSGSVGQGECAWLDRPIGQREPNILQYSGADAEYFLNAVRPGNQFFIHCYNNGNGVFIVTRIGP